MNSISICQSIIETIKKLLYSDEFLAAHKMPNRFIRAGAKLTMRQIITYLFYTSKQSMSINLSLIRRELPELDFPEVTKQAVSKARQGILPSLFMDLFSHSADIYYHNIGRRKKWREKYNIFAIDGSRINIPNSKSNFEKYGEMFSKQDEKRRWSMALCSTIYDVCNDFIVHGLLKRYLGSERDAALRHCEELEQLGQFKDSILIFDRGYYSEAMFRYFVSKGCMCVMRVREGLNIAKKCTGDCTLTLPGNPKEGTEDIDIRMVAVPLDGGETEYLATNVFDNSLSAADFKELYFMRWPIESKYAELKNQFRLEEFSGATSTSIEQEFYINLLLSNIASLLKKSADDEIGDTKHTNRKYRYQANRAFIIANLKWFMPRFLASCQTIDTLADILKDTCTVLSQVQPGRKCKRKKKNSSRERKHFNNRKQVI